MVTYVISVLSLLLRLHERLKEEQQAAGAYNEFINKANAQGVSCLFI